MITLNKEEALSSIIPSKPFRCNDTQVDEFFNSSMVESDREYHTKTMVYQFSIEDQKLLECDDVVGFYSSIIGNLNFVKYRDKLKDVRELNDSNSEDDEGLPVVILHYIGRHIRYRGYGIGKAILIDFLIDVFNAYYFANMGISGVVLQATEDVVSFYESLLFVNLGTVVGNHSRVYTVMFLSMNSIIELVGGKVNGSFERKLDLKLELSDLKDEDV